MKDRRGLKLGVGDTVVYRIKKSTGRVAWRKGEVISIGNIYVHVLADERRVRLLPEDTERLR